MSRADFDLIVFDWDGTLFDSTIFIARCIQAACVDLGIEAPGEMAARYVIGLGLRDALEHAVPDLPASRYAELSERFVHHYRAGHQELALFPGTLEMLDELKAEGYLLAVATGKGRGGLDEVLRSSQLHGMFDATRTADETASKPNPRMLLELLQELAIAPARAVMVGDTTHDLLMARAAGMASIGVSYGAHEPASFDDYGPRHVAHSVADLREWLARHG